MTTRFTCLSFPSVSILKYPALAKLDERHCALFVSEAKVDAVVLEGHIPQTVSEMYACAKTIRSVH